MYHRKYRIGSYARFGRPSAPSTTLVRIKEQGEYLYTSDLLASEDRAQQQATSGFFPILPVRIPKTATSS